jgi:hypothetical protein
LAIGFTDHFNTQLVTTPNYSTITDFHTLHFNRAHAKSFPARSIFTSSFLVTASNNGSSSASGLKPLSMAAPFQLPILVKVKVILGPTVSRPVYLGIKHPTGAYDQIFVTVRQFGFFSCGALSLTRGRVCPAQSFSGTSPVRS